MIRNPNCIDRLYLSQGDEDVIYLDTCKIPQHSIEGIRFLYKQFKRRRCGVILNDPFQFTRNTQICLFIKAVRPLLHRPILILCQEGSEQGWTQRFDTWTDTELVKDVAIETANPYIDKMVIINTMVNLHLFCAREWSIIIVDGDYVRYPNPILMLPFKACFKIWNTEVCMKEDLGRFEEVYKWIFPRETFQKHYFIADLGNAVDVVEKSVLLDTFFEDIVLRRPEEKLISFENFLKDVGRLPTVETTISTVDCRSCTLPSVPPAPPAPPPPPPVRNVVHVADVSAGSRIVGETTITATIVNGISEDTLTMTVGDTSITPRMSTPTTSTVTTSTPTTSTVTTSTLTTSTPTTPTLTTSTLATSTLPTSTLTAMTVGDITITPTQVPHTSVPHPSVPRSPSPVPVVTISRKDKDTTPTPTPTPTRTRTRTRTRTGTKLKRSKITIQLENGKKNLQPPFAALNKIIQASPISVVDETKEILDYNIENYGNELIISDDRCIKYKEETSKDIDIKIIELYKETVPEQFVLCDEYEELDTMYYGVDTSISAVCTDTLGKVDSTASDKKETEPHTILTCKPVCDRSTYKRVFSDTSSSPLSSRTSSWCSDDSERDKKNDKRKKTKHKLKPRTKKPEVDIIKINVDKLNKEMSEVAIVEQSETPSKKRKSTDSCSQTATSSDEIQNTFNEKYRQCSVSVTKVNTEHIANSRHCNNVDVEM